MEEIKTVSSTRAIKCELARVNAKMFPNQAHIAMESALTCIEAMESKIAELEAAVLSANAGKVDATNAQAVVKELLDDECDAIECNYQGKRYRLDLVALESPTQQAIDAGKV